MAQQILATKFLQSAPTFGAVMGAGLFMLILFSASKTETCYAAMNFDSRFPPLASPLAQKSSSQKKAPAPDDKTPDEIALDYHPWQPGLSTFVVVREDGSVKLIRFDRHQLTVSEHKEGVLAPADVAEFFTMIRTRTVTRALRLRRRYTRDWGDADLFYLTSRTAAAEQTHWFSAGERAPQMIFSLVEKLLGVSKNIKSVSPGNFDRYLRAERLSAQDTRAVLDQGRPFEIDQFPSSLQEVIGRAVAHPSEFFLITAEQAGELQRSRKSMLRRAASVYDLRLFESFISPSKPTLIKEPLNEEVHHSLSRSHSPPRFERRE
jgi:hypothetical protein